MLQLTRQARSAWKTGFICTSCRALLASGATRLPGAVARLCAARHYSSPPDQHPPPPPPSPPPPTPPSQQEQQQQKDTQTAEQQTAEQAKTPKRSKPSKRQRKRKARRSRASSASASASSPTTTHQLWRETLNVLKEIKADQRQSTPQTKDAHAGTETETPQTAPASGSSSEEKPGKGKGSSSSSPQDEKTLEGALVMLKKVLRQELRDDAQLVKQTAEHAPCEKAPAAAPKEAKTATTKRQKSLAEALGFAKAKAEAKAEAKADAEPAEPAAEKPAKKPTQEPAKPAEKLSAKASSKTPKSTSKSKPAASSSKASKTLSSLTPLSAVARHAKRKGKGTTGFVVNRIDAAKIELTPIEKEQPPVPRLAYGLDRVLFNPGVYHIRDPRSRVFNFDPYLERIMPIKEFDFEAIKQYVTSSKDMTLIKTAAEHQKKYTGSTSSMTSTLAHFHYLLSAWRPINPCMLSKNFEIDSYRFTRIMRAPAATFLHWKDGTYAIDADKEFDTANILSMLGKSMEKFLTLPKQEFEKYRKINSDQLTEEERNGPESYHYTTLGDFLMRSQLDAYDPRLPGTGMFDLKTRAVISIRMDAQDFHKGLGYEIRTRFGNWESFEREYYDMIRSAFLKYSLQVRMGRMDGIFVAYHNTERIFGFQYIPLQEMDLSLHGQENTTLGDREFKLSVYLLNKVLDKVTKKYPGRSLRLHFETRGEETPFMYIFAKPVTPREIEEIQGATRAKVEEFERQMMGVVEEARALDEEDGGEESLDDAEEHDMDESDGEEITSSAAWEEVMLKVEDELEDEEHGVTFVREAIEDALQESGLLRNAASDETQRYVDAFLEALTGNGRRAAPEDHDAPEPAASGEAEPAVERSAGSGATPSIVPEATEQAEQSSGEPHEYDAQPAATESSSAEEPTLKDLIVKLATQIRAAPSEQRTSLKEREDVIDEDESEYALKLRKIERLLSELTDQPPQGDKAGEGAGSGVVETGEVLAEDGQQVKPTEPSVSAGPTTRPEHAEAKGETAVNTKEAPVTPPKDSAAASPTSAEAAEAGKHSEKEKSQPTGTTESPTARPTESAPIPFPAPAAKDAGEAPATPPKASSQPKSEPEPKAKQAATESPPAAADAPGKAKFPAEERDTGELYGLILTVRNKVDGQYVTRPEKLHPRQRWQVEYAIEEVKPERAHNLYKMVLKRRKNLLYPEDAADANRWREMFSGRLEKYSARGRKFRRREDERLRGQPVHVYGEDEPLPFESVYGEAALGGYGKGNGNGNGTGKGGGNGKEKDDGEEDESPEKEKEKKEVEKAERNEEDDDNRAGRKGKRRS
ncbi:hypothetical protein MYCTH_2300709 [Thermothelomyces thermophilus ATCC 42464]|uniref:Uncharacterized protein n=1 Tax=Thermothelomyces thermophilus (strain ATCC 42464 / BCRC 31852 / DSM 1799) TaxID=573729 RepID=G2Q7Y4_THET4|nr:uncharacterized protein MYCTH_2300709 [Thermothelomyces thermophilus ATCC 42464]AEO56141.1 hypothetical protein MYCTH_2300709 [Thermothelomyces thermophilus ATCC 42464]